MPCALAKGLFPGRGPPGRGPPSRGGRPPPGAGLRAPGRGMPCALAKGLFPGRALPGRGAGRSPPGFGAGAGAGFCAPGFGAGAGASASGVGAGASSAGVGAGAGARPPASGPLPRQTRRASGLRAWRPAWVQQHRPAWAHRASWGKRRHRSSLRGRHPPSWRAAPHADGGLPVLRWSRRPSERIRPCPALCRTALLGVSELLGELVDADLSHISPVSVRPTRGRGPLVS